MPFASSASDVPRARGRRPMHPMYRSAVSSPAGTGSPSAPFDTSVIFTSSQSSPPIAPPSSSLTSHTSNAEISVFSSTVTPWSRNPLRRRSAIVSSRPMRSSADIAVERTTIVTSAPSLRKMFAISIAMIPDPATTTDFGRKSRPLTLSLSTTRLPSKGIDGGCDAYEPVQSSTFDAATSTVVDVSDVGRTLSLMLSAPCGRPLKRSRSSVASPCK